jgi:hypothetical protein
MTKYDEMCAAAAQERTDFNAYRERSLNNLLWLVRGFINHCEIPEGRLTFLRWNGQTGDDWKYTESADGGKWTLPGAISFDDEDRFWHVGLYVTLTSPDSGPENWVSFALCVAEEQGLVMVRVGFVGKLRQLDLTNPVECAGFCDEIVAQFSKRLKEPRRKPGQRKAGFDVAPVMSSGGEKEVS